MSVTAMTPEPHASSTQRIRGLLYPNFEIIFAAQSEDPEEAPAAAAACAAPSTAKCSTPDGSVENAALIVSEAATLIMVPGR